MSFAHLKANNDQRFPTIYKVSCLLRSQGCPCYDHPPTRKILKETQLKISQHLFHAQAVIASNRNTNNYFIRVRPEKQKTYCWYPKKKLEKSKYSKVLHSHFQDIDHRPVTLKKLLSKSLQPSDITKKKKIRLGWYWPTYYHLALEDFHDFGPIVDVLSKNGKVLAKASQAFLEQVRWQGSGISKSGLPHHIWPQATTLF